MKIEQIQCDMCRVREDKEATQRRATSYTTNGAQERILKSEWGKFKHSPMFNTYNFFNGRDNYGHLCPTCSVYLMRFITIMSSEVDFVTEAAKLQKILSDTEF